MSAQPPTPDDATPDDPAPYEGRLHAVWLLGALVGGIAVLPALVAASSPIKGGPPAVVGVFIVLVLSLVPGYISPRTRSGRVVAGIVALIACFGLSQVTTPGGAMLMSVPLGIAIGLMLPRQLAPGDFILQALVAATLIIAGVFGGRDAAAVVAGLFFAIAAFAGAALAGAPALKVRFGWAVPTLAALVAIVGISIIGATTPRGTWFGSLTWHGPRSSNMVAITFDDGPNPPYSLQVRDVLDKYNVKATFFSVGKAVAGAPDVTKALLADGMIIGNHTYSHNGQFYLNPFYPQLAHGQDVIRDFTGVCPAFFRPPHGTHTPFMSRVAGRRDMHVITWDVSAGDWATTDYNLVAQRILDGVKPGSIILLHDGLDGNIGADRSVVVKALPLIIEGLQKKGLQPVTLDKLLGEAPYLDDC